ncbi:hypothetical protein C8R45DRAFT_921100 [Mycena sanguinolenta]|nr:hypothetical protein C8R45DRAFT_921100 [Mycena sanguinolenta]
MPLCSLLPFTVPAYLSTLPVRPVFAATFSLSATAAITTPEQQSSLSTSFRAAKKNRCCPLPPASLPSSALVRVAVVSLMPPPSARRLPCSLSTPSEHANFRKRRQRMVYCVDDGGAMKHTVFRMSHMEHESREMRRRRGDLRWSMGYGNKVGCGPTSHWRLFEGLLKKVWSQFELKTFYSK